MNNKIFYCDACGHKGTYTKVIEEEEVTVKDLTFTNTHEYYQCSKCKELFEPFDDIDKNLNSDFDIYRRQKNLLNPIEIIAIREKYKLSQRQFAEILSISHSSLSRIENGAIQAEYQNSLFVMASSPSGFKELVSQKLNILTESEKKSLLDILTLLTGLEMESYKPKIDKLLIRLNDSYNYMIREVNCIRYDIDAIHNSLIKTDNGGNNSWTETTHQEHLNIFSMKKQY